MRLRLLTGVAAAAASCCYCRGEEHFLVTERVITDTLDEGGTADEEAASQQERIGAFETTALPPALSELEQEWREIEGLNFTGTPEQLRNAVKQLHSPQTVQRVHDVSQTVEEYWELFQNYVSNVSRAVVPQGSGEYFHNVSHAVVPSGTWEYFNNVSRAIYPESAREFLHNLTRRFKESSSNNTTDGQRGVANKEDKITIITIQPPPPLQPEATNVAATAPHVVPPVLAQPPPPLPPAPARPIRLLGSHAVSNSVVLKLRQDPLGFVVTPARIGGRAVNLIVSTLSNRSWAVLNDAEFMEDVAALLLWRRAKQRPPSGALGPSKRRREDLGMHLVNIKDVRGQSLTGTLSPQSLAIGNAAVNDVDFVILSRASFGAASLAFDGLLGLGLPVASGSLASQLKKAGVIPSTRMGYFHGDRLLLGNMQLTLEDLNAFRWTRSVSKAAWVVSGQVALPSGETDGQRSWARMGVNAVLNSASPFLVVPRAQFVALLRMWLSEPLRSSCSINNDTKLFQCPCRLMDDHLQDLSFTLAAPLTVTRQLSVVDAPWDLPPPTVEPQNPVRQTRPARPTLPPAPPARTKKRPPAPRSKNGIVDDNAAIEHFITPVIGGERMPGEFTIKASSLYRSVKGTRRQHHGEKQQSVDHLCSLLVVPGDAAESANAAWTFGAPVLQNLDIILDPESLVIGLKKPALDGAPTAQPAARRKGAPAVDNEAFLVGVDAVKGDVDGSDVVASEASRAERRSIQNVGLAIGTVVASAAFIGTVVWRIIGPRAQEGVVNEVDVESIGNQYRVATEPRSDYRPLSEDGDALEG